MLTRSWGSCKTITTLMRPMNQMRNGECGMRNLQERWFALRRLRLHSAFHIPHSAFVSSHQLQHAHPLRILAVAAQVNPPGAAAPDELPRPPQTAGQHFVHDEVEADLPADVRAVPIRPGERERDAIPVRRPAPR